MKVSTETTTHPHRHHHGEVNPSDTVRLAIHFSESKQHRIEKINNNCYRVYLTFFKKELLLTCFCQAIGSCLITVVLKWGSPQWLNPQLYEKYILKYGNRYIDNIKRYRNMFVLYYTERNKIKLNFYNNIIQWTLKGWIKFGKILIGFSFSVAQCFYITVDNINCFIKNNYLSNNCEIHSSSTPSPFKQRIKILKS